MSSHLRLGLPSGLFPSAFPTKTRIHFPSPARLLHAPIPAHTVHLLQSPVPPSLTPSSTALPIQKATTNNFIAHFNPRPFMKRKNPAFDLTRRVRASTAPFGVTDSEETWYESYATVAHRSTSSLISYSYK